MPKSLSGGGSSGSSSDGIFPSLLVNAFAARLNSSPNNFTVYNTSSTAPLFKINGQNSTATFYCDLDVVGNASFTSISNIAVDSNLMSLANNNTANDLLDIGFYGQYNASGIKYRGLVKSIALDRWILFKNVTTVSGSIVTLSGSYRDNLEVNDIYFNGDGSTLSALQTDLNTFPDELINLTTSEIKQLENINSTTISTGNWSYVATLDQHVASTSHPTFAGINFTGASSSILTNVASGPGVRLLSNAPGDWTGFQIGRTETEYTFGISGSSGNHFYASANAGDICMKTENATARLFFGNNDVPGICINEYSHVTIGDTNEAKNLYNLYVKGSTYCNGNMTFNHNTIANLDEISATTLTGALSTTSHPAVTTLAGITTLGTAGTAVTVAGPVLLSSLADNTNGNVTSGTFVNSVDNLTNITSVALFNSIYTRIGNIANVTYFFTYVPQTTTANTIYSCRLKKPISTNGLSACCVTGELGISGYAVDTAPLYLTAYWSSNISTSGEPVVIITGQLSV
jgi:hypothetical protein